MSVADDKITCYLYKGEEEDDEDRPHYPLLQIADLKDIPPVLLSY